MTEPAYQTRTIILVGNLQRNTAKSILDNAPLGIEVVFRQHHKKRTRESNSFQWAGMLRDFVEQGWVDGRQFSAQVWHEHLKRTFLPEQPEHGVTLKGYEKWGVLPSGEMILTGSTTKLTTRGMAQYLTQCMAYGAQELGIRFTDSRGEQ